MIGSHGFDTRQERRATFLCHGSFSVLTRIRFPFHSPVTGMARKRPRSFYQKYRWQITLKHTHSLDPAKSQRADLRCTGTVWESIREANSHGTRQGTIVHSRVSSLRHFGQVLA